MSSSEHGKKITFQIWLTASRKRTKQDIMVYWVKQVIDCFVQSNKGICWNLDTVQLWVSRLDSSVLSFLAELSDELHINTWQVGSLEEAQKAIYAGVDAIIVQGYEAGGHVIGQVCAHWIQK
jgi:hypothetical protein